MVLYRWFRAHEYRTLPADFDLQAQGLTPAEIRAAGGGAATFSINSGNPFADVSQTDYGVFLQDDWRVRPNSR